MIFSSLPSFLLPPWTLVLHWYASTYRNTEMWLMWFHPWLIETWWVHFSIASSQVSPILMFGTKLCWNLFISISVIIIIVKSSSRFLFLQMLMFLLLTARTVGLFPYAGAHVHLRFISVCSAVTDIYPDKQRCLFWSAPINLMYPTDDWRSLQLYCYSP